MSDQVRAVQKIIADLSNFLSPDTLSGAIFLLMIFIILGGIATSTIRKFVNILILKDKDNHLDHTTLTFLSQFARAVVWIFVLMLFTHAVPALDRIGTALLASVSIASVVIGLAAQSTLSNLIAGISLIFYKPFKIGDRLEVSGPAGLNAETGTVESISLGYTIIQTFDNRRVIMANSVIANQILVNMTSVQTKIMAQIPLSISYSSDIEKARSIALDLAAKHPDALSVVGCPVVELGGSSVNMSLRIWCADAISAAGMTHDLLEKIKASFDLQSVEIPYSYQNIIIKSKPSSERCSGLSLPQDADPPIEIEENAKQGDKP